MNQYKIILPFFLMASLVFQSCKVTRQYQNPQGVVSDSLFRAVQVPDTATMAMLPWQQLFRPKLQALIAEGIRNNFDLKIAQARTDAAQASFLQSKLALLPSLNANANAAVQQSADVQGGGSSPIYQLYANAAWQADIWGKLKSAKRAQRAVLLQSEAYKRYVQTQLIAQIASNYYLLESYDAQLKLTLKTIELRKEDVAAMRQLKESDVVTGAAVVQSEANQYSVEITVPDLQQNIRETENALCMLLGRNPGNIDRDSLSEENIVTGLATGVPAQLLANRPDIQEAQYQLQTAFELTNAARTYFYPSLNITAQAGFYNNMLSDFFNPVNFLANIIGGLTQPIFNNGANKQRLAVATAQQEESLQAYKKAWLAAGQEVSNALFQYQAGKEKTTIREKQIASLQKSVEYTQALLRYTSNTNYTDVLTSEQSLLSAQLGSISDKLQQLQAVVSLYVSLGGGWR
jgi:NodT family efflux transporter outer membrane factor (OMF) lipoprotein